MFRKKIILFVGIASAGISVCVYLFLTSDTVRYSEEYRKLAALYPRFEQSRPPDVAPFVWQEAWVRTQVAIVNVCAGASYVDIDEFSEFRSKLEQRIKQPIRVETLIWIWDELERIEPTGDYGDNYVARYKPLFLRCIAREREGDNNQK